jgi:tripartite-type tricarboxylate transporter receptor subunit TctC
MIAKVLAMPEVREFYASQNVEAMPMTPTEFTVRVRADYEKWGKLIRDVGLRSTN